ncbi:MAG TPA: RDD family protein [Methylomirabilota bacterium]
MSDARPAARWRLLASALTDAALGLALWVLAAMWLLVAVLPWRRHPLDALDLALLATMLCGLAVALHVVYHTVLIGGCGQTVGKMLLGIAVVRRNGGPAGYGRALLRVIGGGLCVLTLGLGELPVLFTRERRGLSDVIAGTRPVSVT